MSRSSGNKEREKKTEMKTRRDVEILENRSVPGCSDMEVSKFADKPSAQVTPSYTALYEAGQDTTSSLETVGQVSWRG